MTANFTTLIEAGTLADHIGMEDWCVVDCRHDLARVEAGREAYNAAHIPGAVFMHLEEDLAGPPTGDNGRHPLPDPQQLADRLGTLGIDPASQVVAYDASGGMFAARLWWLLRWLGHEHVCVLDGGYQAWQTAGLEVSNAIEHPEPLRYRPTLQPGLAVGADYVANHLNMANMVLIDARSPERFRGEGERLDPVGGHIPGAVNRFFQDNLNENGLFKPAAQLRVEFEDILGNHRPVAAVHQCGSGVTACHNLLAMEIAGLGGSRLYPGSWSEWCADPSRPIATDD